MKAKKDQVLFSPSTRRVIWEGAFTTYTYQLDENYQVEKTIASTPKVGLIAMSESCTNAEIKDWIRTEVGSSWIDLKPLETISIP